MEFDKKSVCFSDTKKLDHTSQVCSHFFVLKDTARYARVLLRCEPHFALLRGLLRLSVRLPARHDVLAGSPPVQKNFQFFRLGSAFLSQNLGLMKLRMCMFLLFVSAFLLSANVPANLFAKERNLPAVIDNDLQSKVLVIHSTANLQTQPGRRGATYSHFLNGSLLERRGEFDKALQEYDRVLELEPSATLIYRQRAGIYLKMGNPEKALANIQSYVRTHPDDVESLLLLSNIHLFLGQRPAAQLVLEKVLEQNPDHAEALMTLATLMTSENPNQAIRLFEKYVQLNPTSTEAYYNLGLLYQRVGDPNKSRAMFEKVIQIDNDSLPSLVLLGQMSEKRGDMTSAIQHYESALQKMPENFSLRMQLVLLYAQKMEMFKIEQLLDGYKNDPNAPIEAYLWLGIASENKGDFKKALEYYSRARQKVKGAELNIRLATLYSQMGKVKNAVKSLREIVREFPENPQYRYFLGLSYMDVKKPHKAIEEFKRAVGIKKDFSSAFFQMGVAYDSLKRWKEAEQMFRYAIRADTANASAYNYLGYTYADRNEQLFEARRMIERALELDQNNPAYLDSLGWLNFREGNYTAALSHLKFAAEKMPDAIIHEHLGDCYFALGNFSEAALSYSKCLEYNPKNKPVRKKLDQLNKGMVPTSTARKMLKQFEYNLSKASNISGMLLVHTKVGYAHLFPAGTFHGDFYMRKHGGISLSTTSAHAELRVDLLSQPFLPAITLRYQSIPPNRWHVFPPELENQIPRETEMILEMVTSFLSGNFFQDFDRPETKVEHHFNTVTLRKGGISMHFNKKTGLVSRYEFSEKLLSTATTNAFSAISGKPRFENIPFSIKIQKYQKIQDVWLPQKIRIRWHSSSESKNFGTKPLKERPIELQMEFFHLSLQKIENKIFEIGKEP